MSETKSDRQAESEVDHVVADGGPPSKDDSVTGKSTGRKGVLIKRGLLAFALLLALTAAAFGGVYYYLFEQTGDPVESLTINETTTFESREWQKCLWWSRAVRRQLRSVETLSGQMRKQERIDGKLEPISEIDVKMRRSPLSVYLHWNTRFRGREVIFQTATRGNRLVAHEGGALRAISPDFIMPLDHQLAMQFSRHPVNEMSLQYITRELPRYFELAQQNPQLEISFDDKQILNDTECVHIRLRHPQGTATPELFCRFDLYVNKETKMPMRWERYQRFQTDDGLVDALVEYFEINNPILNEEMGDEHFDPSNPNYNFKPDWTQTLN